MGPEVDLDFTHRCLLGFEASNNEKRVPNLIDNTATKRNSTQDI